MSSPPEVSIWLDIPGGCGLRAEFTGSRDIQFTVGEQHELGHTVVFERPALERFVRLAMEVLAQPDPLDRRCDRGLFVSQAM